MPTIDSTRIVTTRVDQAVAERLERMAQVDRRPMASVVRILIERALPDYEREVIGINAARAAQEAPVIP